jgi:hypothetical protein
MDGADQFMLWGVLVLLLGLLAGVAVALLL